MLLHPWTDLLSAFCRLFAWCITLCDFPCFTRQGMNEWMEVCLKIKRLVSCSLNFSIHGCLQLCHSQSRKVEPFFPQKNLIMRKIHIGENVLYSHDLLAYSIQINVFWHTQNDSCSVFFLFNSYFLNITVTDPDGLNSTQTVNVNIINVNDERPYFTTWVKIFQLHSKCMCFLRFTALAPVGGFNIRTNNDDNKILLEKVF